MIRFGGAISMPRKYTASPLRRESWGNRNAAGLAVRVPSPSGSDNLAGGAKTGGFVLISFEKLAAIGLAFGLSVGITAQAQAVKPTAMPDAAAQMRAAEAVADPVADPRAVVTLGKARFTVLTPELIRMEWAADGKFEDHASFVFINRRLPVPKFEKTVTMDGQNPILTLKTSALTLTYSPVGEGQFTPQNLSIELTVDGKQVVWHPGMPDPENLQGTTRTLDGALGDKTKEPIGQGLISRSGWALVDDSTRPLFDSADFRFLQGEKSPWPWVMERPAGESPGSTLTGTFSATGTTTARRWATMCAWPAAFPCRRASPLAPGGRATGITPTRNSTSWCAASTRTICRWMCWSSTWAGTSAASSCRPRARWTSRANRSAGPAIRWNKLLFPDPDQFLDKLHAEGLKTSLNLHPASGIQPWEKAYPAMARAMGIDPATKNTFPSTSPTRSSPPTT